jgi:hypothetical protein
MRHGMPVGSRGQARAGADFLFGRVAAAQPSLTKTGATQPRAVLRAVLGTDPEVSP